MTEHIIIDESIDKFGRHHITTIEKRNQSYTLTDANHSADLHERAIVVAMKRYGRELSDQVSLDSQGLVVGTAGVLIPFRFHARVDADERNYLAWCEQDRLPIGALSRDIAAALRYLSSAEKNTKEND